uniref:Uncharacterized protein n=1 Tax=Junco hyemalis TaxID=40217 RepID=A0A8C5JHA9_JUNHY
AWRQQQQQPCSGVTQWPQGVQVSQHSTAGTVGPSCTSLAWQCHPHIPGQFQPHIPGQCQSHIPGQCQCHIPGQCQSHIPGQCQSHIPGHAPAGLCWRSGGRGVPRAGASLGNYVM